MPATSRWNIPRDILGTLKKVLWMDSVDFRLTFSLVCIVHCETSSGVINDVSSVAELFGDVNFFIDAMSSFGAVPLDLKNAG